MEWMNLGLAIAGIALTIWYGQKRERSQKK